MRKWTEEERQKQAEAIRKHKPWEKSTGPKTRGGKRRSKMNAYKYGLYTPHGEALRRALLMNREFVRGALVWVEAENRHHQILRERTDKKPVRNEVKSTGSPPPPLSGRGTD